MKFLVALVVAVQSLWAGFVVAGPDREVALSASPSPSTPPPSTPPGEDALATSPVTTVLPVVAEFPRVDPSTTVVADVERVNPSTTDSPRVNSALETAERGQAMQVTSPYPSAPADLEGCEEMMSWYRQAAGLPEIFDSLGWRESNCRNEDEVKTWCCHGFECSVCGYRQGPFPDRNSAEEENHEHDC